MQFGIGRSITGDENQWTDIGPVPAQWAAAAGSVEHNGVFESAMLGRALQGVSTRCSLARARVPIMARNLSKTVAIGRTSDGKRSAECGVVGR